VWIQKELTLQARPRGFHLITDEIVNQLPELLELNIGLLHIFILHSSASLTINENADPSVLADFESYFNRAVAENEPYYTHTYEGSDDMPAHIKASMLGSSVSVPITDGYLNLGVWQGIYLCEHRDQGGSRNLIVTINAQ
jgi:secondary thiamine-phosphate synthase enzyme